jgi:hypothetical protein
VAPRRGAHPRPGPPFLTGSAAQAALVTIVNGTQFTDPNGDPVHGHAGDTWQQFLPQEA